MSWATTPPSYAARWLRWASTARAVLVRVSDEPVAVWGGYGPSPRERAERLLHEMSVLCLPYPSPGRPLADNVTAFPGGPRGSLPGEPEVRALARRVVRILAGRC